MPRPKKKIAVRIQGPKTGVSNRELTEEDKRMLKEAREEIQRKRNGVQKEIREAHEKIDKQARMQQINAEKAALEAEKKDNEARLRVLEEALKTAKNYNEATVMRKRINELQDRNLTLSSQIVNKTKEKLDELRKPL